MRHKAIRYDALVKSPKSPFDKLRANGGLVEIIDFIPFVVSLSNHRKDFLRDHQIWFDKLTMNGYVLRKKGRSPELAEG